MDYRGQTAFSRIQLRREQNYENIIDKIARLRSRMNRKPGQRPDPEKISRLEAEAERLRRFLDFVPAR